MLHLGTPVWQIALRSATVYVAVLAGLRLAGKREIGQLSVSDLVLVLLIANAVQNAMVGPDTSLTGGLVSAATLLALAALVAAVVFRSPLLSGIVEGTRVQLVMDGRPDRRAMARAGVTNEELLTAIHENQIADLADVYEAFLEPDGQISVLPVAAKEHLRMHVRRGRKHRRVRQLRKH
ncbi:MAG TPA: YetF domain-containing protein [Actinomycetota bacterium]|nr:YetF domain-containing protein [Actinomycetota bacterium]